MSIRQVVSPSGAGAEVAGEAAPPLRERRERRRRVPRRFFVGTILLYALVLGTFLLSASPLHRAIPNWHTVVPLLACVSFYLVANLFLLILGRGRVSRWVVLRVVGCTFVATGVLCLFLRARLLHEAMDPARPGVAGGAGARQLVAAAAGLKETIFAGQSLVSETLEFAGMVVTEELVKLLPVFALIALGRIRTVHGAMLCGALSGLTFGTVEAISYGSLDYPAGNPPAPVTTYFTRFFVMSPLHGIWDALGGGLVFFLSGRWRTNAMRRPGFFAYASAFACAVVFHVLHNALQHRFGPATQIATVFALLAPMYLLARIARRRSIAQGEPENARVLGDLHMLTIAMATVLLAASVAFSWAMGLRTPAPRSPEALPAAASISLMR